MEIYQKEYTYGLKTNTYAHKFHKNNYLKNLLLEIKNQKLILLHHIRNESKNIITRKM